MAANFEAEFNAHLAPGPDQILTGAVLGFTNTSGSRSYIKALGHTDTQGSSPLSEDAVFWSASCTKLICTIACLKAVELGYFSLDSPDDVARLLPELINPDVITGFTADDSPTVAPIIRKATSQITLRHLLTHSSGLAYDIGHPLLTRLHTVRGTSSAWLSGQIPEAYAPAIIPLVADPGTTLIYGPGPDWAGLMLERADPHWQRLGAFMATHIFQPLGMHSTTFDLTPALRARLMPMAAYLPDGTLSTDGIPPVAAWSTSPRDHCGGAGLYTTTPDFLKVLAALLRNDGTLLRCDTVDAMFAPQTPATAAAQPVAESLLGQAAVMLSMPQGMPYEFSWGGIIACQPVEGRLGTGTLMWAGMPNLLWWIDRETGCCAFFGTQYLSLFEQGPFRCDALRKTFQRFVHSQCTIAEAT